MTEPSDTIHALARPTDVLVCLRSGVWNLTNPDHDDKRIPSRTQRAIMRGLLLAAIETLDEVDMMALLPTTQSGDFEGEGK